MEDNIRERTECEVTCGASTTPAVKDEVKLKGRLGGDISSPGLLELVVRKVPAPHQVSPASRSGYQVVAKKGL